MPSIIGTGTQRAAKTSRVQVGSTNLCFASWEANVSAADLPTINFESYNSNHTDNESYSEGIYGSLSCEARFGGAWDAGTKPTGTVGGAPGLYPRDELAEVRLYITRAGIAGQDAPSWYFPYMRIRGVSNTAAVEQLVLFNVTDAKNQGRFVRP